jgi:glycosyltransferase involved in cell wall biosynthesis
VTGPVRELELSVVMPCLNEAATLGRCIERAQRAMQQAGVHGEVIVADNGSTDGSRDIAERAGARVVPVRERGYGAALMGGIAAAKGRFVIMGDADESYDFGDIPRFLEPLRAGFDLVQGCRLPSGGGIVEQGAMPPLHRWLGNPLFTALARLWFGVPLHDVHCGLRAFRREWQLSLDQRCTGMEFATEMVIKASKFESRITEIPITLHPDRRGRRPHLRTWRDGWRHLRFYLMYSPRWLFLIPGALLMFAGAMIYWFASPAGGRIVNGVRFDVHTLLFASLAIICGYQAVLFAVMTKTFAIREGLMPQDARLARLYRWLNLETGLLAGAMACVIGLGLLATAVAHWWTQGFGPLDYTRTMRIVIPGMTLTTLGFQTVLSSFFLSILGMRSR